MQFILVLLLAFTLTPLASFADENRTVIDVYQEAIQKLDREYRKLKQLTAEARQKAAELEKETNSVKNLIAKYEAALNTTKQELLAKHEAELKIIQEAYQAKLKGEADLAELARKSAENDAEATRTLLDELGTSAEQVAKLTNAVSVKNGNVGIGTTTPAAKLDVAGNLIRTIAYATGNGPNDDTDNGQIKSRVLTFNKARKETKIRISYTDTLRIYGNKKSCHWEIRVNGNSCPNQALVYGNYTPKEDNTRSSHTVVGYCSGIAAGSHTIGIWVSSLPRFSGSDCTTGWENSTWVIEAEEVN